MRVALLLLVAGCDALFLQENARPLPPDGPPACAPEFASGRYFVNTTQLAWGAAELACRELGGDGVYSHLAIAGSAAEASAIGALISGDAWVGLTNLGAPATFHWITREPAMIPWIAGQPDDPSRPAGNCGRLLDDGSGLADSPCATDERRSVCECDEFPVDPERL